MRWGVGPELLFHEGGKVGRSFFLVMETFLLSLEKNLMGVASLLPTFPPSWNGNSGPTPHFITLTHWTKLLFINWTHCRKILKLYKQYYHILECILGLYRVHLPVVLVELLHNRHLASKMLPLGYQTKNL